MAPQPELVGANGRRFAGFAAAVFVFIIDPATRRILMLSSPAKRPAPGWEVVNGGLEAGETLLEGASREVAEEAGPEARIRMLGTVHAWTWRYDDEVTHMLSTAMVAAYLGGDVVPGDDMAGSTVWWATPEELAERDDVVPGPPWLIRRAMQCFDLWIDDDQVDLQPSVS